MNIFIKNRSIVAPKRNPKETLPSFGFPFWGVVGIVGLGGCRALFSTFPIPTFTFNYRPDTLCPPCFRLIVPTNPMCMCNETICYEFLQPSIKLVLRPLFRFRIILKEISIPIYTSIIRINTIDNSRLRISRQKLSA